MRAEGPPDSSDGKEGRGVIAVTPRPQPPAQPRTAGPTMPSPERKAKLPPSDRAAARPTAPAPESLARHVRVVGSVARPVEQDPRPPQLAPPPVVSGSASPEPPATDDAAEQRKQALAADLEDMIGGMLRTTQFAAAATVKTRSWTRPVVGEGPVPALKAGTDASAVTPNSLVADLARSGAAPATAAVQAAVPRRRWIDAVLVLACVLSVLSAGYFTLAP
jgi:hypothetical protein